MASCLNRTRRGLPPFPDGPSNLYPFSSDPRDLLPVTDFPDIGGYTLPPGLPTLPPWRNASLPNFFGNDTQNILDFLDAMDMLANVTLQALTVSQNFSFFTRS